MLKKMSLKNVCLPLQGGLKIHVPDSLELITPYVLREQEDWFEDEIKFLRKILQTGERIIDIGANYGTYTLSMAQVVGKAGAVWAFEPATSTAACLRASVEANGYDHVVVDQCALSSAPGSARLALNLNSELNALVRGASSNATEEVQVFTLDDRMDHYGWTDIAFLKIDAEGEEENILAGGRRFFSTQSPLVEFEYKAGREVNEGLVEAFAALGFSSYRLVPGLDVLVPFPPGSVPDGFLLNLFCCKSDRAAMLHERGILVRADDAEGAAGATIPLQMVHHWRNAFKSVASALDFLPLWEQTMDAAPVAELESALDLYFFSHDTGQSHVLRAEALARSLKLLKGLCEAQPLCLRECTYARVAREFGARQDAVMALNVLAKRIFSSKEINPREPFLLPLATWDGTVAGSGQGDMVFAAVLEGLEVMSAFSSFYSGESSRGRLELIRKLGFGSPEMGRRLDLLNRRFAKSA